MTINVIPTAENVAAEIWNRLEPRIQRRGVRLKNVRLYETADLYVDCGGRSRKLTCRYRFSASHRLQTPTLSAAVENQRLYGKCNNPYGHGHDYVLDVTLEGARDVSGQVANRAALDALVAERCCAPGSCKNLNTDVTELAEAVPTTENLASAIREMLMQDWYRRGGCNESGFLKRTGIYSNWILANEK